MAHLATDFRQNGITYETHRFCARKPLILAWNKDHLHKRAQAIVKVGKGTQN